MKCWFVFRAISEAEMGGSYAILEVRAFPSKKAAFSNARMNTYTVALQGTVHEIVKQGLSINFPARAHITNPIWVKKLHKEIRRGLSNGR